MYLEPTDVDKLEFMISHDLLVDIEHLLQICFIATLGILCNYRILILKGDDKMKVKYIGEISHPLELINGKIYECLGEEGPRYRVIDETDEDYLYPKEEFIVVED